MKDKTILDLCGGSGGWSEPYRVAGYNVIRIDLKDGHDVRLVQKYPTQIHGILAAPPCDHFALSGARWWAGKGESALLAGLSVVDACLRIVAVHRPVWWALENPVGRLVHWLGKPVYKFDPCDFGGWLDPAGDDYTKRTCLWGSFSIPIPRPVEPTEGSKMWRMGETKQRAALRSVTPRGFALAFFASNP